MAHFIIMMIFVMVCICFGRTAGCSCPQHNLPWMFCTSDYVIKAKVNKEFDPMYKGLFSLPPDIPKEFKDMIKEQYATYQYAFDVIEIMRSSHAYETSRKVLQTFGSDALCGLRLREGETYIIGGYAVEDVAPTRSLVLGVSLCDIVIRTKGNKFAESLLTNPPNCTNPEVYMSDIEKQHYLKEGK